MLSSSTLPCRIAPRPLGLPSARISSPSSSSSLFSSSTRLRSPSTTSLKRLELVPRYGRLSSLQHVQKSGYLPLPLLLSFLVRFQCMSLLGLGRFSETSCFCTSIWWTILTPESAEVWLPTFVSAPPLLLPLLVPISAQPRLLP